MYCCEIAVSADLRHWVIASTTSTCAAVRRREYFSTSKKTTWRVAILCCFSIISERCLDSAMINLPLSFWTFLCLREHVLRDPNRDAPAAQKKNAAACGHRRR